MPSLNKKTIATYDTIASAYRETRDRDYLAHERKTFENLLPGTKIIDIACGSGRDAPYFLAHDLDYVGIDASQGMLNEAIKVAPHARFELMDFHSLTFSPNTFDGFWAAAAIVHTPKRQISKLLRGFHSILKPQGIGFISFKPKINLNEGIITEHKFNKTLERYFAFYSIDEFTSIVKECGFIVVSHHTLRQYDKEWVCFFVKKA